MSTSKEKLIQADLNSEHDSSMKHQLITQVCKHAELSDSEARNLWKTCLLMSVHGPSSTHRSGARIVLDHLKVSHNGGRNGELHSILQFFAGSGIDLPTACELMITLSSVMTEKAADGWILSAPHSLVKWFIHLCCTHATEWPPSCQIAIARVLYQEGLLCKIGASDDAGRLLDVALTWIVVTPDMDELSDAVVVLVTALSRGLPMSFILHLRPTCSH